MIRNAVLYLALLFVSASAMAETLKSELEAKQLTDKVMVQVAKGDLTGAFALMKPYVVISESEFQGSLLQSKSQRDQFGSRYGKPLGYEFIAEKKAGESILRLTYIEKTARHALPWAFIFYKTPTGWVLNSYFWNDNIQSAFQ
ncbi:hypothetical protein [Uliginosibacterium gangwonense]|uniref:hypothetical protein n=1 Tax=Uliginosibacterium gangwonense TaxID=392736 RepID=UPI000373C7D4|nr:hypothetical protein [Uliginosibacterium gangwonense]